ncbi:MAG TPA: MerR family transcriptional regulator [Chloroflexi bacterium]|nr:MerR family transcriptional regulator [Chloroflexota bacterium]
MNQQTESTSITITVAARRSGLTTRTVRRYVQRGLVSETLTENDLAELRRIRRLTDLGINLCGVEVILHMRQQIEELRAELDRLRRLAE